MANRIASQNPFILLPRYGEKYEGMARQIKDVIGVARQQARSPEDLAFAEYVANNTAGARLGRAINKRQVVSEKANPTLREDRYFGSGSTIDPFFLPYKAGFDRTINDFLAENVLPYKGDMVEKVAGIDYQDRLAAIAHIPKMMERWDSLPKVEAPVYRGIASEDFFWNNAKEPQSRFTSTSQDRGVAERFAKAGRPEGGQVITILSKSGRRLASKDGEEEVLFAPKTTFVRTKASEPSYIETEVSKLPPIPSYEELKSMSKKYEKQKKHKEMLKSIDYAKAQWSWTEAPQEAVQQSLATLDALANKMKGDYNYREIKQALSNQYDFIDSFKDDIPF